jgi:hypothetical protein
MIVESRVFHGDCNASGAFSVVCVCESDVTDFDLLLLPVDQEYLSRLRQIDSIDVLG